MRSVTEVVMWVLLIVGLGLVITHASGFARSVSAVGDESNKVLATLQGGAIRQGS